MRGVPLKIEIILFITDRPMPLYLKTDNKTPNNNPIKTPPNVNFKVSATPDPMDKKLEIILFI
jgi:hypothetical protein